MKLTSHRPEAGPLLPLRSRVPLGIAVAVLTLLGFVGNFLALPITFSVDFLFGSIFTLLVAVLAGPRVGVLAALLASSPTWVLWNHPYAIVIFTAEALWVGLAFRRGFTSILLAASSFWLCLGIPLVVVFYGGLLHLDYSGTTLIILKQTLNGIFNALVADVLLTLLPLSRWLGESDRPRLVSFTNVLFQLAVLLLMLPTLILIRVANAREAALAIETLASTLRSQTRQNDEALGRWIAEQVRTARAVAELGAAYPMVPSARLQEEIARFRQVSPDLHNLFLVNAQGRTVAFDPPLNDRGESTLGVDFSSRDYFHATRLRKSPVVSDVFMGRAAALQPIFTISAPIQGLAGFGGIGGGAVNLEKLKTRLMYHEDPRLVTTILDSHGRILVSTQPERKSLELLTAPAGLRVQTVAPDVILNLPSKIKSRSVMEAWKTAYLSTRLPIQGTDWTLLTEYPMAPLRDRLYQSTIRNFALLGVCYLVALGLGAILSRLFAQAPAGLVAISRDLPARVESGQAISWPDSRLLEISQLIDNFRGMAEALARRIQEIHREEARNLDQERALIHQSRLAAMGEMVGNIAHQWRQPLSALAMLLGDMKDAQAAGELTEEHVQTSIKTGQALIQKMSLTISDFMNFSHPDKAASLFSLRQQTEDTLRLLLPSLQASPWVVEIEDGPEVWVLGHPNEFSQVILNLLGNARDAIEGSGIPGGRVRVSILADGDKALVRFSDNGGGIKAEPIERIFEPYFSGKPGGTGLGLYMSRMILEQSLKGTLEARNIPGGAEFLITLPLRETSHALQPS